MKRILYVVDEMSQGGVSKVLIETLRHLNYDKFHVDVLVLHKHGELLGQIPENVGIIAGSRFFSIVDQKISVLIEERDFVGILRKLAMAFYIKSGWIRPLIRWERKKLLPRPYDIEIAYKDGFCTLFTACGNAKNKLAWIHADYAVFQGANRYRSIIGKSFQIMDQLIAVSPRAGASVKQAFGLTKEPRIIANPINAEIIRDKSKAFTPTYEDGVINFICVGRLCEAKGFDRLLSIHSRLIKEGLIHKVYIVGEGEDRKYLEELRRELLVEDSFIFLGYQENPYPFICSAECYILSSRHEGSPVVVTESLLLGIPLIATDVADVKEKILAGPYGLVTDNNEEDLYQAIRDVLIRAEQLSDFRGNLRGYKYDISDIMANIESVFCEVN